MTRVELGHLGATALAATNVTVIGMRWVVVRLPGLKSTILLVYVKSSIHFKTSKPDTSD